MNRQFFAPWLSRLTIVMSVLLAFVLRCNTQEGGDPGIFGGRTPIARRFLDQVPWPGEPFAFYVAGMAQWILVEPQRAEYDYLRSGQPPHYRYVLHA